MNMYPVRLYYWNKEVGAWLPTMSQWFPELGREFYRSNRICTCLVKR